MTGEPTESTPSLADYALEVANSSYDWYRAAAINTRRRYRTSEAVLLIIAASIPTSAVIAPDNTLVPAVLGSLVVVVSGLRGVFHWHENYLRFSRSREAVEAERRAYRTSSPPYDDPETREQQLVAAVTSIEQEEMSVWLKIAARQPKPQANASLTELE